MSYQSKPRHCGRCGRSTTHWRELPDLPRAWAERLGAIFGYVLQLMSTRWNCRGCKGVPRGPLTSHSA